METVEHLKKGLQYAQNREYCKAESEFDSALSYNQNSTAGLYYRGCTRLHQHKFQLAIEDFNLAISSSNLPPEYALQAIYQRGIAHQKLCQYDFALDSYKQLLSPSKQQNNPKLIHKVYFSIGTVYASLNQHELAISHFHDAIKNSGESEEDKQKVYYLHRGRAFACCTDFRLARDDLKIVILESNNPFYKGCAFNELGQHDQALQQYNLWFESSLNNNNNNSSSLAELLNDHARFRRGLTYASLNRHDNAIIDYQNILDQTDKLNPSTIADRVFFRKAISSMILTDVDDALISFNRSISLNNRQSDVFYARGMLHFTLGRHDAAVYDHRHALALDASISKIPPIYQTFYHKHNYNPNYFEFHMFHQEKLREAEVALKNCEKQGGDPEETHRKIAEYQQQLAPYANDPEETLQLARKHIQEVIRLSSDPRSIYDCMTLSINELYSAQVLCDKYPAGILSERIINQFVSSSMNGILGMSRIVKKCALEGHLNDVIDTLNKLQSISAKNSNNPFNSFRLSFIQIQLNKAKTMQRTSERFKDSPPQHEFYTLLMIHLCNFFDAVRVASTGIFQHTLKGTLTKISYIPMVLGYICDFLPVVGQAAKTFFDCCNSGLKMLDETRIQSALTYVGTLDTQENLNKAADTISEKLTIMYKWQIEQFPSSKDDIIEEKNGENASCCGKVCLSCSNCCKKSKNWVLNERETSNMESIVKYGFELIVNSLAELEVSKVNHVTDLNNFFINAICHTSYLPKIYCHIAMTKIQPKYRTKNVAKNWNTYDFFRRPGIQFSNNDIRVDTNMDVDTFGCRGPSWKEAHLYEKNQKELDKLGLIKYQ